MKRFLTVTLSTVLLAGSLAACSPNDKASSDNKNGKVSITWFDLTAQTPVPEPGNEAIKKVNKKFNIDFKPQYIPVDLYDDKLSVKMASGDIPDVIGTELVDTNYVKWAKQGAFLPLNDYVKKYENFKAIPQSVWDAVSVDGKIYGIPLFFPSAGGKRPIIRQDWLDKLGLKMPTNFEELEKVAIAFATQDPDGNGKNDTVGLGLAKGIYYDPSFGVYWGNSWYHKNKDGQLIPGQISEGSKEKITSLNRMFKAGALDKDWAIKEYNEVFKDFNAGKVGIWYEQPGPQSGATPTNLNLATLRKTAPDAKIAAIPAFQQPDGKSGYSYLAGYYRVWMLNSELKNDQKKVEKILEMMDYMTNYVPADEQKADNEYFDWTMGGEGKGYKMTDGQPEKTDDYSKYAPLALFWDKMGGFAIGEKVMEDYAKQAKAPEAKEFNNLMYDMLSKSNFYISPVGRVHSDVFNDKAPVLSEYATNEFTKMIVGQRPISDWNKFVEEYMSKGGKDVIDDVNKLLKENKIKGEWVKE
ncbi:extracellular solute-binding protein [Paenibacillus sp. BSR1-1]|uniref:extracellular solute-binding protein n=1 Tax=Paenibacillus sp. BSR1-1 TaxID=3020845 RepID=UPI0025B05CE0|nr:extracellular solute-binding protein [Paenibacillus sp. BSR1-1]MDN3017459.1 extracellular solute-binding protein [Paenibacillus sp. BSR1-1]